MHQLFSLTADDFTHQWKSARAHWVNVRKFGVIFVVQLTIICNNWLSGKSSATDIELKH